MARPLKISVIGAGSATFSLELIRDLCLTEGTAGSTIWLMDIDEERVAAAQNVGNRYARELGVDLRFEKTTDRSVAFEGSDFVCNTASVGAHGGGGFASIHNLRFFLSVARDIERLCPNAWLLQSGNPVFEGCTFMTRETSVKVVGLCHGQHGVYQIADVLGLEHEHVSWQAVGFNHVIYLTHFFYKGADGYAILDEWIENKAEEYWRTQTEKAWEQQMSRAAISEYKMVGLMPIGDTVGGGWWTRDEEGRHYWYGPSYDWDDYIRELDGLRDRMFQVAADPSVKVTELFPTEGELCEGARPAGSREQIVPIMLALAHDVSSDFQVNIPNQGLITGLPDDIVVEVPAFVSKRGIQGLKLGRLPDGVMAQVLWPRLAEAEATLAFAKSPRRGLMLHLVLRRDRRAVGSYAEAEQEVDRILEKDTELARLVDN